MATNGFKISFWGTRGTMPITGKRYLKYGGNTSCIEININDILIIIDAGTGIYHLGKKPLVGKDKVTGQLLLSHVHLDHIQGFPLFEPAFHESNLFHIYGEAKQNLTLRDQLALLMQKPHWPIGIDTMKADLQFHEITAGDTIKLAKDIRISTMRGDHPDGTTLYRIEQGEHSVCYISDYEHSKQTDPDLIAFVKDTDVLIYDATYTEEEYLGSNGLPGKIGWGHSTWIEGCKLASLSGAKQLLLFHHNVDRTDDEIDAIEKEAKNHFHETYAAFDGMEICL